MRSPEREQELSRLTGVIVTRLDVTDPASIREAVKAAVDEFGTIEAVKAVAELFAPVSGEVIEVNATVIDAPETVNEDPYGNGWMIKVSLGDASELENLMDAAAYEALIGEGE